MALQDSRIFGVWHTGSDPGIINGFGRYGMNNRLYVADTQGAGTYPNIYANIQWTNGYDESRFGTHWDMAYIVTGPEGAPSISHKQGTQVDAPPANTDNAPSPVRVDANHPGAADTQEAESATNYIGFKAGTTDASFIEAIQHIAELSALPALGQPATDASAADWKTWADANLEYWTTWTVGTFAPTTPTTPGGETYNWHMVNRCGTPGTTYLMRSPSDTLFAVGAAYDLSEVVVSEGAAPGNIIEIASEASEGTPDFAIGSMPPGTECTA